MADSIVFDGTDDIITCALGGSPTFGPGMIACIFRAGTGTGGAPRSMMGGGWQFFRDSDDALKFWASPNLNSGPALTDNVWYLMAITKASGTATPRFHLYNYTSPGWAHSAGTTAIANVSTVTSITLGDRGSEFWDGNGLIAGIWNSDYSDGALEALNLHAGYQEWIDSAPLEGWRLDTLSAIQSFGSVGTADESSRTGTTLGTGVVPAGWDDTLNPPITDAEEKYRVIRSNLRWG